MDCHSEEPRRVGATRNLSLRLERALSWRGHRFLAALGMACIKFKRTEY